MNMGISSVERTEASLRLLLSNNCKAAELEMALILATLLLPQGHAHKHFHFMIIEH